MDAGAGEGGTTPPPLDAGKPLEDAADGAVTEATGSCASRAPTPKFCDDFDDDELDDDWDVVTILNGEPSLDTSRAITMPASFAIATMPTGESENAHVHLRATASGAPTGHVSLSFDVMTSAARTRRASSRSRPRRLAHSSLHALPA